MVCGIETSIAGGALSEVFFPISFLNFRHHRLVVVNNYSTNLPSTFHSLRTSVLGSKSKSTMRGGKKPSASEEAAAKSLYSIFIFLGNHGAFSVRDFKA